MLKFLVQSRLQTDRLHKAIHMSLPCKLHRCAQNRHGYEAQGYEAEAKHRSNHKAEAEALALWKHGAEAEAQVLPSNYKYPFLPLITWHLLKFRRNIHANMIWIWKMLSFSSFETRNLNVKFWICEVTKPKPFPSHEAEAKDEALSFWNRKAEANALASNASTLWSRSSFVPMPGSNRYSTHAIKDKFYLFVSHSLLLTFQIFQPVTHLQTDQQCRIYLWPVKIRNNVLGHAITFLLACK